MKIKDRLWIWFICLVIFGALMFSMLLAWTPKSSNMVQGVQGRYMLPLLPVFLFTLKNQKVVRTGTDDRLILYTMMAADVCDPPHFRSGVLKAVVFCASTCRGTW